MYLADEIVVFPQPRSISPVDVLFHLECLAGMGQSLVGVELMLVVWLCEYSVESDEEGVHISQPLPAVVLYEANRPVDILLLVAFDMPFDLRDLAFEEEAARKMELLHFAVDCRVFFGGDEGQEVLADRLENGVLSEQIEVLPTLGGLPVDDRAQVVECLWGFVLEAAVYFFEVFAEI